MCELILGAARSGKSSLALKRAHDSGKQVIFVATALAVDAEMQRRIVLHRSDRPAHWKTVEASTQLATKLQQIDHKDAFIIVDCLTLWLSNVLCVAADEPQFNDVAWQHECAALMECLPSMRGRVVLVSNEVGWGIVPDNVVGRRFRDEQGRLNQSIARVCEHVTLVVAGLPLTLKSTG